MSLIDMIGLGKASMDRAHAFWDEPRAAQRSDLDRAVFEAGVNLSDLLGDAVPGDEGLQTAL